MSAILKDKSLTLSIHQDIENHAAWHGEISGLAANKILRGRKTPYLYILRAGEPCGEDRVNYYVSFLLPDLRIHHEPFVITITSRGWCYEQGGAGGPYTDESIQDVLHEIMHCKKEDCVPLNKLTVR